MLAVIVYESMYGNTHEVAGAIGAGLSESCDVQVVPVGDATGELLGAADLVVVGGPTHVHGMSRPSTRSSAVEQAGELTMDPDAGGEGVREWLESVAPVDGRRAAAFDTRVDMAAVLTGRASKKIAKALAHHGFDLISEPESFLVDKETKLIDGELDRSREWGRQLASQLNLATKTNVDSVPEHRIHVTFRVTKVCNDSVTRSR